jgi:Interferon-induced transmembrane protein
MTTPAPEPSIVPTETHSMPTEPIVPGPHPVPSAPVRPPSNVGWAVAALLAFWPLSFSAFTHALNVFPLWSEGNAEAARYASERARRLGILAMCIAGGLLLLFIVLYAIFVIVLISRGYHSYNPCAGAMNRPRYCPATPGR